jgi:transposase InsO family protein
MATENGWRARRIQGELAMLGIQISLATISRYLPKPRPDPRAQQSWRTFLRNHRDLICAMDFFVVPTARFRLLYAWFLLNHGRRRVLHLNVTANPSARWVVQQLREAWQNGTAERFVGTVRRELLDHVVVLNEHQLRRLLREYAEYYNAERVHSSIGNAPEGRTAEPRPDGPATATALRRVGGLHHRYTWRQAA